MPVKGWSNVNKLRIPEKHRNRVEGLKKIKSMLEMEKLGLPQPKTIFIFDFEEQKEELREFLKNRRHVMIRSDKEAASFCPHKLVCPREEVENFVKEITSQGYVAIIHDLEYLRDEGGEISFERQVCGNALILKDRVIVELVKGGPLTKMNRYGEVDQVLILERKSGRILKEKGEKLIDKQNLEKLLGFLKKLNTYDILEFAFSENWFYCWQIRHDETAKALEGIENL